MLLITSINLREENLGKISYLLIPVVNWLAISVLLTVSSVTVDPRQECYFVPRKVRPKNCNFVNYLMISVENKDHDIFRASARRFFREVVHPEHKKFEADGKVNIL